QRAKDFQDQLVESLQAVPGIESAAISRVTPFSYKNYSSSPIAVDGYDEALTQAAPAEYNEVGPGYFATLGIPLVAGREFTRADNETATAVAVVNEAMARQYWRGADPVGKRLRVNGRWTQVVGLAKNAKYRNLSDTARPFFYVPVRQS